MAEHADAELERRVDAQRMLPRVNQAREQQAAEAHPAHEGPEQDAERDRGRADHQLEELKPDDLVDQRGAAAADEQEQQRGKKTAGTHRMGRSVHRPIANCGLRTAECGLIADCGLRIGAWIED